MTEEFTKTLSWKISNKLLKQFQKAKLFEAFSNTPINIGSCLFFFYILPGGLSDSGYITFSLRAVQLGYNISKVEISYKSQINALFARKQDTYTFETTNKSAGIHFIDEKSVEQERLNFVKDELTIKCDISILRIFDTNNHEIDKQFWNDFLMANYKQNKYQTSVSLVINSNMFENFMKLKHEGKYSSNSTCIGDIEFYLDLYPKGRYTKDVLDAFIVMSTTNDKIRKIGAQYMIWSDDIAYRRSTCTTFTAPSDSKGWPVGVVPSYRLSYSNIKSLTARVWVKIISIYDNNDKIVPEKDWDKYIKFNNENKNNKIDVGLSHNINSFEEEKKNNFIGTTSQNNNKLQIQMDMIQKESEMMKKELISLKNEINKLKNNNNNNKEKMNDEIFLFLKEINLIQYYDNFITDGFDDLKSIKTLDEEDLVDMGIQKKGHRKKIMAQKIQLQNEGNTKYF